MYNYTGDPGQYPFFSLLDLSGKFIQSKKIIMTTNGLSEIGNKGVFVLSNDSLGFISKSILGLKEYQKILLKNIKKTEVKQNKLLIAGCDVLSIEDFNRKDKNNLFRKEWGNEFKVMNCSTDISLVSIEEASNMGRTLCGWED